MASEVVGAGGRQGGCVERGGKVEGKGQTGGAGCVGQPASRRGPDGHGEKSVVGLG